MQSLQSISFNGSGEKMVFPISVPDKEGIAKLEISTTSGNESTKEVVEIGINNPNLLSKLPKLYD